MTPTYCPEFDVCSDHNQAGEEEGDTGGRDGEHRTKVQRTRMVLSNFSAVYAFRFLPCEEE